VHNAKNWVCVCFFFTAHKAVRATLWLCKVVVSGSILQAELRKTQVFWKNNPPGFFVFWGFSKRNKILSLFQRKQKNPILNCCYSTHAISLFSELYNNNLLYLLWHSKLRVKQCTSSLISQCVVGKFTPKCQGLASMHTANREKPLPHKLCSFMSSSRACPGSSASTECIFSIYDLACSKIRKSLDAEKAEKLVKIYQICRA